MKNLAILFISICGLAAGAGLVWRHSMHVRWVEGQLSEKREQLTELLVVFERRREDLGVAGDPLPGWAVREEQRQERLAYYTYIISHWRRAVEFLKDCTSVDDPFLIQAIIGRDGAWRALPGSIPLSLDIHWLEDGIRTVGIEFQFDPQENRKPVMLPVFDVPGFWTMDGPRYYESLVSRQFFLPLRIGNEFHVQEGINDKYPIITVPKSIVAGAVYVVLYDRHGGRSNKVELFNALPRELIEGLTEPSPLPDEEKID